MRFAQRPNRLKRAALAPLARTREAGSQVLLTFDDCPHPTHTPAVLDRLEAFDIRAAFFLVGKRITDPALVQRIVDAGHILGNHTFSHEVPRLFARLGSDVARCQALIPTATHFRPPLGKLTPGLWLAARRLGLVCMNWSLDSGDWRCKSEANAMTCAGEVLELARPGDVILFHADHRWIGPILDVVLPGLTSSLRDNKTQDVFRSEGPAFLSPAQRAGYPATQQSRPEGPRYS